MRIDWVPYSAAALVLGATALSVGAMLLPSSGDVQQTLMMAEDQGGQWLAVAMLYFLSSVALTLGMPAVVTLFSNRGARLGLTAIGVFTVGVVGIAGFSMLLVFFRALAKTHAIDPETIGELTNEPGLGVFLFGWVGAFFLGELLLAVALLRAGTTPTWVPGVLIAHVALFPVTTLLPGGLQSLTALLVTVGLCGVGISANQHAARVPV